MSTASAAVVSDETITVWYQQKNKKFVPHRCRVKRASAQQGLLIEHVDMDKNDPDKERYLDPADKNWLIGEWLEFGSKDEAQQVKANRRADKITASLRAGEVRKDAEQVCRPARNAHPSAHLHRHARTRRPRRVDFTTWSAALCCRGRPPSALLLTTVTGPAHTRSRTGGTCDEEAREQARERPREGA